VVAIAGCHYEFDGNPTGLDPSGFDNQDASVVLVAGTDDTVCEASQSEEATTALRQAGFDADLTVLDGASHSAPIFRDIVDDELVEADDDDAGERTVQLIVDAVAAAREVDPKVLVEAVIAGREIEVGVLEGEFGGAPEASVCAEIRSGADFDVPADLPSEVAGRVRELAVRAFTALDCAGLARVGFFVTESFDVYFNEINTMPGFADQSLFPMMWNASGLEFPKLVGRLIRTAIHRGTGLH
jgi:hypothetical protein